MALKRNTFIYFFLKFLELMFIVINRKSGLEIEEL